MEATATVVESPCRPGWYKKNGTKLWRPWTLEDLGGKRPPQHPKTVRRDGENDPIPEAKQVWVVEGNVLMEVVRVEARGNWVLFLRHYRYPAVVVMRRENVREFRKKYKIWDDAVR